VASACGAQANAALGGGWQSSDFSGGACVSSVDCIAKCACSDTGCVDSCDAMLSASCITAEQALGACLNDAPCANECITVTVTTFDGSFVDGG
jgi:hypothetical protein